MIDKGQAIKMVFLKLGENTVYNDNKSDLYQVCEVIFDQVVKNLAYSTAFLFNATSLKLNKVSEKEDTNEYQFNIPIDFLNILRCRQNYRIENEFIYSDQDEIEIQYCRDIPLSEYPNNLFNLLVAMTAREMALAFNTYNKKLELIDNEVMKLKNDVIAQQGFQYWGD
ncbi:hypothetical protein IX317_000353 [Fusobacterium sp. DD29]|uniref:hypothetical protein n=1 Tax=unclassified Fusobacterium TaxID=2648384 RepID=UPI001B8C5DE4|nr:MULTISPECIES: hypothetical protein [unclassified Fusobacterium]MBR8748694.1 hypothetical protein [Fusobacterium sp. DD29]MBR8760954.1 hypothetical protein [Fusobacterium sp. DD25]MBR8766973.1 hypothetical protein [Fusobacterium sp. DD43]MBR8770974.1 hypothetical protein [Fusobacterium sp. DD40]MBR8775249.1 hypothetical protein [Fusobacterium sp. DD17]